MEGITLNTRLCRRQDLMTSDLSDSETVMMDIDQGVYFGLDNVAKDIWDRLTTPCTLNELYQYLGERYEVEPGVLATDTLAFLTQMQERKLISLEN